MSLSSENHSAVRSTESNNHLRLPVRARQLVGLSLLSLAVLSSGACKDDAPGVQCGERTIVVGGRCEPEELADRQGPVTGPASCGAGTVQGDAGCVAQSAIGGRCLSGQDCLSGTCLSERNEGQPGGYCTIVNCNERRPCSAGAVCVFAGRVGRSVCLATCDMDISCRPDGYTCQPLHSSPGSVCAQRCDLVTEGDACGGTAVCNEENGRCEPQACELSADDPCDEATSGRLCAPDRLELGESDGLCLRQCDLADVSASCADNEVCQPLPDGSAAICASPLCDVTAECPAGASCQAGACLPPASCTVEDGCGDDAGDGEGGDLCVAGRCVAPCPSAEGESCADAHPGLSCEPTVGACLPTGAFPGSACLPGDVCDALQVEGDGVPMHCVQGRCALDCATGGDGLCQAVSSDLSCASGAVEQTVCLPAGTFPGGRCKPDGSCDAIPNDEGELPMACLQGRCAVQCDASAGGATLCAGLDASLVCADDLQGDGVDLCLPRGGFPGGPCGPDDSCSDGQVCEDDRCLYDCGSGGDGLCTNASSNLSCAVGVYANDVCLPNGSFPGGPCGDGDACAQNLGGLADADMVCRSGRCVVDCNETDHPPGFGSILCGLVSPTLSCSRSAGEVCVPACDAGGCASDFACLDPGATPEHENACLPTGSFPGSPCAPGDQCAPLGEGIAQICQAGICAVNCSSGGSALCAGVDPSLTCSAAAGELCVVACQGGLCPEDYACLGAGSGPNDENACLPKGSFPGSPCADGDVCADLSGGIAQSCVGSVCAVNCSSGGDPLCAGVDASLTCSESAGEMCVVACQGGLCPADYACLGAGSDPNDENACLPKGSFPGSPCADGDVCADLSGGIAQRCVGNVCAVNCSSGGDPLCAGVDASLTCSESGGEICVVACQGGLCPADYACLGAGSDPNDENACLPKGSFPGSPCADGDVCADLSGGIAQSCVGNVCAVNCNSGGDPLCAGVDASLACSDAAGGLCVVACQGGLCPEGFACLGSENTCLPSG